MKNLVYLFVVLGLLISCKKETTNNNINNTSTVTCVDNPNINFTSIGTPVGKFSDCIKDIDGNTYKTVTIGSQTWMAENLKTSKYNDGTTISNIIDNTKWLKDTSGAWCYYKNDTSYNSKYGKLYNWYAVNKTSNGFKNVCPIGWHMPSYSEWTILTDYLGGEKIAGGKMKELGTTNWNSPNKDASNLSLFTGLPGGCRNDVGNYVSFGNYGLWHSSTEHSTISAIKGCYMNSGDGTSGFGGGFSSKRIGYSIRCIKD